LDCTVSKGLIGFLVGVLMASVSLVATITSSDVLHYISVGIYVASVFVAHLPASAISKVRCSMRQGIAFYLSVVFISWVAVFNLLYVLLKH
jgi:hypothetical protein